MNVHSLKYKAYAGLLEGKITRGEYNLLSEKIGILSRLGSALKGIVGANVEYTKAYNNAQFNDLIEKAKDELKGNIEQMQSLGNKLGIEDVDGLIKTSLAGVLSGAGVKPSEVASSVSKGGKEKSGGKTGNIAKGARPKSTEQLVAAARTAEGEPTEEVEKDIEDPKKGFSEFVGDLVERSKVPNPKFIQKVLKALIDKNMIRTKMEVKLESIEHLSQLLAEIEVPDSIKRPLKAQFGDLLDKMKKDEKLSGEELNKIKTSSIAQDLVQNVIDLNARIPEKTEKASASDEPKKADSKKFQKIIDSLGDEFKGKEEDLNKVLDALGDWFLIIPESRNVTADVLVERWQRIAKII